MRWPDFSTVLCVLMVAITIVGIVFLMTLDIKVTIDFCESAKVQIVCRGKP